MCVSERVTVNGSAAAIRAKKHSIGLCFLLSISPQCSLCLCLSSAVSAVYKKNRIPFSVVMNGGGKAGIISHIYDHVCLSMSREITH